MTLPDRPAPRTEGPDKLCGIARYIDDYSIPGCLFGVTLRSSIARGVVTSISYDPGFPWDECVIATAQDLPGKNVVTLIEPDQPLLVDRDVRHPLEPILLIAHADRSTAYAALEHVRVEYREATPLLTIEDSLDRSTLIHGEDNIQKRITIVRGDVEAALATAETVVEGEYFVPHQEQAYIENNGMAAWFEDDGTLVALGSLQCPYYVQKALGPLFALPPDKVRVIQAMTGGGFGGKEEYPNMIAGHAALLAWKAKRPVKIIYDRHEDMLATTKRHPARVRHRTGVSRDGRLVAQEIDVVMDGGAYVTLSPVVLSRGALHATGPYECPNVRVNARSVATNTPPNGAFRGFGAPQTVFAAEMHMERIAAELRIDPLELRRRNIFREGSTMCTGQRLEESVGASEALETCARKAEVGRRRREHARWNKRRDVPTWRGVGIAVSHHGAGFTGSGEAFLKSRAAMTLTRDGDISVLAASTEIGQGTTTMFTQIAAETLGVPYDWISIETPDTGKVPDSGPTVASRTCMVVGGLLKRAATQLREEMVATYGTFPSTRSELRRVARRMLGEDRERRYEVGYEPPAGLRWDDATYRGDAYAVYSYGAVAVDLEIDRTTYEITLRGVTCSFDIGRAIHPLLAEGQVIGGTAQALGWALLEEPVFDRGVMQNAQLTNYIIPTTLDTPPMDVSFVETRYSGGPFGAKGVGELPMDVPAPAVGAAVINALGVLIPELPFSPERIMRALGPAAGPRAARKAS